MTTNKCLQTCCYLYMTTTLSARGGCEAMSNISVFRCRVE